ncbi:MAG TPA: cytidylate kinase-like family protein [Bacteroidales bacterium]|nr:cytidylate kinase-like family protein [Bacteroidales bacterium]HPS17186.1 cytidylate kinase-like family protein [Bacteroidales bacterium]
MDNFLIKYLSERLQEKEESPESLNPVITISREFGCWGNRIAEILCQKLLERSKVSGLNQPWKWITREIMEKSALDLKVSPEYISDIFNAKQKGTLADIILSFGSQYLSNEKIKATITNVVKSYCKDGYVIMVGRASNIILKDYPKALHVKLFAPFEWRAECYRERQNLTVTQSRIQVKEMEKRRAEFLQFFRGSLHEDEIFDLCFNRKTINENEIVDTIISILESKKYI